MQKMQRKFGAFLPRTANDAQVDMLLSDFEAADRMLQALIEGSKAWRDAWADILNRQSAMLSEYLSIYSPIVTAEGGDANNHAPIPRHTLERVNILKDHYMELKNDMLQEIAMVDKRIIEPAKDAKASVKVYKKVIKKREDRKLDYERYKSRVESSEKKSKRSDRENTALAKHRIDLDSATVVYQDADEKLKSTLPQITSATYSILPLLLNAQIMIQNTLLAQLYTTLHQFSQDYGFPSPPPEMEDIIAIFEQDFTSLRLEAEGAFKMLALGKAIHQPMSLVEGGKSYSGLALREKGRGALNGSKKPIEGRPAGAAIEPPSPSTPASPPAFNPSSKPRIGSSPGMIDMLVPYEQGSYFDDKATPFVPSNIERRPSTNSLATTVSNSSFAAAAAAKKKPPPPPPPASRKPSFQSEFVIALYDFPGEGAGDLSFREGDRIRIVKKTGSVDDWWDGELRGVKGSFPANYVEKAR